MFRHRHAPWIALLVLMIIAAAIPFFVDELTWARGGGDVALVVFGLCLLALALWERAVKRP